MPLGIFTTFGRLNQTAHEKIVFILLLSINLLKSQSSQDRGLATFSGICAYWLHGFSSSS